MLEKNGLVKLNEECGELGDELSTLLLQKHLAKLIKISAKKMTCMDTDVHWDGQGSLKERLENEIADVMAAIDIVIENFDLSYDRIEARAKLKRKLFAQWMSE